MSRGAAPPERKLVLVVDDDLAFRADALSALRAAGYDAESFGTARAAVEWTASQYMQSEHRGALARVPIAVFFDLVWSDAAVREFLIALEANPLLRPMRRILVSKVDLGADEGRFPDVVTIRRPIDPGELAEIIERNTTP